MTTTISDSSDTRKAQHLPPRTASVSAYPDYTAVYTDGSVVQDSTGSAFTYDDQVFSYRLHSFNSIFTAEVYGMYRDLLFIRRKPRQYHLVCTDSLSGLLSLCGCSPDYPTVVELLIQLFHLIGRGSLLCFAGFLATVVYRATRPLMLPLNQPLYVGTGSLSFSGRAARFGNTAVLISTH
jgi:hypothetical protein